MEALEIEDTEIGQRSEPRTNTFVMASMSAPPVSGPVRIRNLSSRGALIESAQLPNVGDALQLRRGALSVTGQVVWKSGSKAGLRLDQTIIVADWLPSGHSGQKAVDNTFQRLREGRCKSAPPQANSSTQLPFDSSQLRQIARALDALADSLAEDAEVIARHASKLQTLDIASQMMRKIAEACRLADQD